MRKTAESEASLATSRRSACEKRGRWISRALEGPGSVPRMPPHQSAGTPRKSSNNLAPTSDRGYSVYEVAKAYRAWRWQVSSCSRKEVPCDLHGFDTQNPAIVEGSSGRQSAPLA